MPLSNKITLLGGDRRQIYMADLFVKEGFHVMTYGLQKDPLMEKCEFAKSIKEAMTFSDIILCPVPLTRNQIHIVNVTNLEDMTIENLKRHLNSDKFLICGNIPEDLVEFLTKERISSYDLMRDDNISILNAIATAEGTIMEAIKNSTINLHKSKCLVLGYGKCATVLAKKLSSLDAEVCIAARKKQDLLLAKAFGYQSIPLELLIHFIWEYDFIFNTIPKVVLNDKILKNVSPDAVIIDIASAPGGLDYEYVKNHQLNAAIYPGLPGKVAPKASADILTEAIILKIKEGSVSNVP